MTDPRETFQIRKRLSAALVVAGVLITVVALALQNTLELPFNARIIGGLGILAAGIGLGQMLRYHWLQHGDRQAVARMLNEERDERSRMIRAQAGSRAFWVSLGMTFAALMWLSFAGGGLLPHPSEDALWFYLVAAVTAPMLVYIGSYTYGLNRE